MKQITEYLTIIQDQNDIDNVVQARIDEGWQPIGGVSVTGRKLVQAMVKYDRSTEERVLDQINDIHHSMVYNLPDYIQRWSDAQSYPRNVTIAGHS